MSTAIPLWEKLTLTLEEAAALSGIGINRLRDITNDENCTFVLFVGNRRRIKRAQFIAYLANAYSL